MKIDLSAVSLPDGDDTYKGMGWDEPSRAIVASGLGGEAVVLWYTGAHLSCEIEEHGLKSVADLGLEGGPDGLSVWEGKYVWHPGSWECPQDGDSEAKGSFRALTAEEWEAVRTGRSPWASGHSACVDDARPVDGTCCVCQYLGQEETVCSRDDDGIHCVHWGDGPKP